MKECALSCAIKTDSTKSLPGGPASGDLRAHSKPWM